MKITLSRSAVIWNYLNFITVTIGNILLLPFILKFLDINEIGLWYLFTSFGMLAILLDLGLSSTIIRNTTLAWAGVKHLKKSGFNEFVGESDPNYELLAKVKSTAQAIYLIISLVVFMVFFIIGSKMVVDSTLELNNSKELIWSWYIYLIAIVTNIFFAYWQPLLKGIGAIKESNKGIVYSKLIQITLTIAFLLCGFGLLGVSVAYLFSNIFLRIYCIKSFNNYYENKVKISKFKNKINYKDKIAIFLIIFPNAYKQGFISLSNFLQKRSLVFLSTTFYGLEAAAVVGLTQQLIDIVLSFGNTLFNAYLPAMTSNRVNKKFNELKKIYFLTTGISLLTISIGGIFIISLGPHLLGFISEDMNILPFLTALILLIYNLLYNNHLLAGSYIATSNIIPMFRPYIVTTFAVLIIQILGLIYYELNLIQIICIGLALNLTFNNWYWPFRVKNEFNLKPQEYFKESILVPLNYIIIQLKNMKERDRKL